jgi:signal transduction histidine kinase
MKLLLSIYFLIFAAIQFGLLLGISHYLSAKSRVQPNSYWISALGVNIVGLFLFAIAIFYTDDIKTPPIIATIANIFFYLAAVLQGIFFYSLGRPVKRNLKIGLFISVIIYGLIFEYLRTNSNFEVRTCYAVIVYAVLLFWQIKESYLINRQLHLQQLRFFIFAAIGEGLFLFPRLIVLLSTDSPIRLIDQLPQLLIIFTLGQFLMNTISFIAIWGYWSEYLASQNRQTETNNEEFKKILEERETLIASLLKANKTSSTGALSASIAHEINQPLAAIQINSEFLQRKLQDPEIDRALILRIADDISKDNMRAAHIIRALKSIFTEKFSAVSSSVSLAEVIDSVLLLSKFELNQKQIQVEIDLEDQLQIPMSFGEAQQLFLNLINNSVQAFETNKAHPKIIRVRGKMKDESIQIRVEDNGLGIPPEQQQSLFNLFVSTKHKGMGLGLWLCNYVVTRYGGRIKYEDQHDGGAAFVIIFTSPS